MKIIKGGKSKPADKIPAKRHLMKPPAANPDRYFVAFVELTMPVSSAPLRVWPRSISETFLFEQPTQPSLDDVMATAKKAWGIAEKIDITNFYEMNETDYTAFLGDESGWTVIDE